MLAHEISVLWAPTHPPSLNFCSSSSKAKPIVMQGIRDHMCRPVLRLTKWINVAIPCGPYLPYGAFSGIFHLILSGWKVEPFVHVSPTYPLFEINQREYDNNYTMVPQH
jgi:hypothetical protein